MSEGERRCRTCRFYQAAPLAGKGWCRNPVLYAPSQQHLVEGREVDCQRAFGDFWQAPLNLPEPAVDALAPGATFPHDPDGHASNDGMAMAGLAATTADQAGLAVGVGPTRRPAPGVVRVGLIAALVTLLSALIGLLALDTADSRPSVAALGPMETPSAMVAVVPTLRLPEATPTAEAQTTVAIAPTLAIAATPPIEERQPVVEPTAGPTSSESVPVIRESPTVATPIAVRPTPQPLRTAPVGKLRVGGQGVVDTGTPEQRLRLRNAPDLQAVIVGRIANGSKLAIIDGPRQADGETWWRVRYSGATGWVAGTFVQPAA